MNYEGVIKKSRTLDLAALSSILDAVAPVVLILNPQDIGVTALGYAGIRMAINGLQAYLRFKTTTPIGDK